MSLSTSEVDALKSLSDWWFIVECVSTAIVFLGVVGEYVAEFTSFAKKRQLVTPLSKLSTLVLILGLAGELVCLERMHSISGQLTAFLENRVADTEKEIESERLKRVNLEALVAPRRLSPEQQRQIGDAVRKFAGQPVIVTSYGLDGEGAALGAQIIAALMYGNLAVVDRRADRVQSGGFDLGVHVRGPAGEFISSLEKVLGRIGKLQTTVNAPTTPRPGVAVSGRTGLSGGATISGGGGVVQVPVPTEGPITILVGIKPAPVVPVKLK